MSFEKLTRKNNSGSSISFLSSSSSCAAGQLAVPVGISTTFTNGTEVSVVIDGRLKDSKVCGNEVVVSTGVDMRSGAVMDVYTGLS